MKTILIVLLIIPLTLLRGWILLIFWNWFILPLGAPHISLFHSLGISLVLNYMIDNENKTKDVEDKVELAISLISRPFFILLLGWIIKSFI
jgi:hypothetical protein